jgi:hypothetical protein
MAGTAYPFLVPDRSSLPAHDAAGLEHPCVLLDTLAAIAILELCIGISR